jgi:hypothetical protein
MIQIAKVIKGGHCHSPKIPMYLPSNFAYRNTTLQFQLPTSQRCKSTIPVAIAFAETNTPNFAHVNDP